MKGVLIVSKKGGVGKTTLCHLLALGAAWRGKPAHMMHTDNREPLRVKGRPYMYYDARDPETLATLMGSAVNSDGFCIIDSGGNRAEFDKWLSDSVDLVVIPVTPDPEAVLEAKDHMQTLEREGAKNVRFLLNMVSSNKNERIRDHAEYFNELPRDKIIGQLSKVAAVKRLRENDMDGFQTPPSNVNNLSRRLYSTIQGVLSEIEEGETSEATASA